MMELRPCICGRAAHMFEYAHNVQGESWKSYRVECTCGMIGGERREESKAAEAWNRRASDELRCPFCGEESTIEYDDDSGLFYALCAVCQARTILTDDDVARNIWTCGEGEIMPDAQRSHLTCLLEEALEICTLSGGGLSK